MEEKQWKGMGLAIMGALFWGLSGTSVQFLESAKHINVEWLLEVRLLVAGILTIGLAYLRDGKRIFSLFKEPKDIGKLLIFGVLGIALAQYTYFRAIAISGVGVATVLQYVAPTMIIIYLFLRYFKKPSTPELFCILLALVGTICIVMQEGLDISSFNAYMEGIRLIGAVQGSILSSLEPISAALFGWALLGNEFTVIGIFGMICILATVFIIAWDRQRTIKREVLAKLNKIEIV